MARIKRTGVLELIGDRDTTIGSGFVGQEVSQDLLLIRADDGQGKLNELGPGLGRGAVRGRNVVEVLLTVHEGDMEVPELLRSDTGNLRVCEITPVRSYLVQPETAMGPARYATGMDLSERR